MTLGEKIAYYRIQKGFSQKGLAEAMGITNTRLNYWEKDKREPDVKMMNLLCRTLDIDPNALIFDEDVKKAPAPSEDDAEAKNGKLTREDVVPVLTALGFVDEGENLTDSDFLFLESVIGILDAWFQKRGEGI